MRGLSTIVVVLALLAAAASAAVASAADRGFHGSRSGDVSVFPQLKSDVLADVFTNSRLEGGANDASVVAATLSVELGVQPVHRGERLGVQSRGVFERSAAALLVVSDARSSAEASAFGEGFRKVQVAAGYTPRSQMADLVTLLTGVSPAAHGVVGNEWVNAMDENVDAYEGGSRAVTARVANVADAVKADYDDAVIAASARSAPLARALLPSSAVLRPRTARRGVVYATARDVVVPVAADGTAEAVGGAAACAAAVGAAVRDGNVELSGEAFSLDAAEPLLCSLAALRSASAKVAGQGVRGDVPVLQMAVVETAAVLRAYKASARHTAAVHATVRAEVSRAELGLRNVAGDVVVVVAEMDDAAHVSVPADLSAAMAAVSGVSDVRGPFAYIAPSADQHVASAACRAVRRAAEAAGWAAECHRRPESELQAARDEVPTNGPTDGQKALVQVQLWFAIFFVLLLLAAFWPMFSVDEKSDDMFGVHFDDRKIMLSAKRAQM